MTQPFHNPQAKLGTSSPEDRCESIDQSVRDFVHAQCGALANSLSPHDGEDGCECGHSGDGSKVDLILLIDQSGSMSDVAPLVSDAIEQALAAAKDTCGATDVRTIWFTVDPNPSGAGFSYPNFAAAGFTLSHEEYLASLGTPGPFAGDDAGGYAPEEGADAITDLAQHFDWREGACRAIFYISDERLNGYNSTAAEQDTDVAEAVAACNANSVAVFAHYEGGNNHTGTVLAQNTAAYTALCAQTGGRAEIGGAASTALYETLLTDALCQACNGAGCASVEWPDIKPCIDIKWGQSECDCMESDDHEVLCITLCNCYDNVTFTDVSIKYLWLTDEDGNPPPTLPDGSPSGRVYPLGPICFGDIGPCGDGTPTCVSGEAVVILRGIKPGKYKLNVGGLCFGLTRHTFVETTAFELDICAS